MAEGSQQGGPEQAQGGLCPGMIGPENNIQGPEGPGQEPDIPNPHPGQADDNARQISPPEPRNPETRNSNSGQQPDVRNPRPGLHPEPGSSNTGQPPAMRNLNSGQVPQPQNPDPNQHQERRNPSHSGHPPENRNSQAGYAEHNQDVQRLRQLLQETILEMRYSPDATYQIPNLDYSPDAPVQNRGSDTRPRDPRDSLDQDLRMYGLGTANRVTSRFPSEQGLWRDVGRSAIRGQDTTTRSQRQSVHYPDVDFTTPYRPRGNVLTSTEQLPANETLFPADRTFTLNRSAYQSTFKPTTVSISEADRRSLKDFRTAVHEQRLYFDGTGNVRHWLTRVETAAGWAGLSTCDAIIHALPHLFRERAALWYQSIAGTVSRWENLAELLLQQYEATNYDQLQLARFLTQTMCATDDALSYFFAMKKLADSLNGAVVEPWQVIARGLNLDFQRYIDDAQVSSFADLELKIKSAQQRLLKAKAFRTSATSIVEDTLGPEKMPKKPAIAAVADLLEPPPSSDEAALDAIRLLDPQSISCWNCGATGHISSNCSKPRQMYCRWCRTNTHTTKMCDAKRPEATTPTTEDASLRELLRRVLAKLDAGQTDSVEANQAPKPVPKVAPMAPTPAPRGVGAIGDTSEQRPYLLAKIGNITAAAMLDTGANITVCNSHLFDQIQAAGFALCDTERKICTLANGEARELRGFVWTTIAVGSKIARVGVHLLEGLRCPLLLGIDAQSALGLYYVPTEKALYLSANNPSDPPEKIPAFSYLSEASPRLSNISSVEIFTVPEPPEASAKSPEFVFDHPDLTPHQHTQLQDILQEAFQNFQRTKGLPMKGEPIKLIFDPNTTPI